MLTCTQYQQIHFVHKAWHDHSDAISKLEYSMIGDPSQTITRNFDVLDEETGLAQRGTFIIDLMVWYKQQKSMLTESDVTQVH